MQKVPFSSEGAWTYEWREPEGEILMKYADGWRMGYKKPCSNKDLSKVEHGYILSILVTLISQVSNAGFSPKIAAIPTP